MVKIKQITVTARAYAEKEKHAHFFEVVDPSEAHTHTDVHSSTNGTANVETAYCQLTKKTTLFVW